MIATDREGMTRPQQSIELMNPVDEAGRTPGKVDIAEVPDAFDQKDFAGFRMVDH
jgi:hypothetical protein